ncbi:hypothetical protein D9599_17340 [Roseomonas sp. KE2513]|uniref:hypothetical protein n=1 Tax=Roseomonas sp. KE2513 TaxID=2479202 RepID=UPI0018DFEA6A|nr:hypothetical protein [Roseomonas sp. KE2513]MBI0537332.1 hypothetical protein [Roseomonas sp. KE2513]
MNTRVAMLIVLAGVSAGTSALAQGATGAISRPGWSRGGAPTSDFNTQGRPLTRNELVRQRAAAAQGVAAPQPRRSSRQAHR